MKLINSSFEIIEQKPGLEGIYKQIELAGRTCYHSESNITEDSAKGFVDRMIKSGHGAMLEHGTAYLYKRVEKNDISKDITYRRYLRNHYSFIRTYGDMNSDFYDIYITSNFRVLVENNWLNDLEFLCEPTEYHEKRYTVRFITDQGILREFTRHRAFSFGVESTR